MHTTEAGLFQLTLSLIAMVELTHFIISDCTIWPKIGLGHET